MRAKGRGRVQKVTVPGVPPPGAQCYPPKEGGVGDVLIVYRMSIAGEVILRMMANKTNAHLDNASDTEKTEFKRLGLISLQDNISLEKFASIYPRFSRALF